MGLAGYSSGLVASQLTCLMKIIISTFLMLVCFLSMFSLAAFLYFTSLFIYLGCGQIKDHPQAYLDDFWKSGQEI